MTPKDFKHLVGLTIPEALEKVPGYTVRAMTINGKSCVGTADVKSNRINVSTKDGKIVSVKSIG